MKMNIAFQRLVLVVCLMLAFDTVIGQANTLLQLKEIPYQMSWLNQPKNFSYANGVLRITAGAKTDMFRDPNVTYNTDNAPKLLFEPDSNFVLSTSIQHTFQNKWDGGAIVLFEDSIHWIKFCFEKDYTGAKRVVSVVTKDISDDCNSAEINSNIVYYKMAKADNVITLYYSLDGKKWFLIRHLQFNNLKKIKIGFLAQSPTGDSCTVAFSDIQYRAIRIKDPYQGE